MKDGCVDKYDDGDDDNFDDFDDVVQGNMFTSRSRRDKEWARQESDPSKGATVGSVRRFSSWCPLLEQQETHLPVS